MGIRNITESDQNYQLSFVQKVLACIIVPAENYVFIMSKAIATDSLPEPLTEKLDQIKVKLKKAKSSAQYMAVSNLLINVADFYKDEKTQKVLKKIAVAAAILAVVAGIIALGVLTHGFGLVAVLAAATGKGSIATFFTGIGLSAGHAGASHAAVTGVAGTMSKIGVFGGKTAAVAGKAAILRNFEVLGIIGASPFLFCSILSIPILARMALSQKSKSAPPRLA